ncbi:MAG: metallophosphoesterase family protein [Planctomycetota bacterium]|jgi:predicted phosphodiesterase
MKRIAVLLPWALLLLCGACALAGENYVDVEFPLGNEKYVGPKLKPSKGEEATPAPEGLRDRALALVGKGRVVRVKPKKKKGGRWHELRVEGDEGRFDVEFDAKGKLREIEFKSHEGLEEKPGRMILPGGLKAIPPAKVPGPVAEAAKRLFGEDPPMGVWEGKCAAGTRYFLMGETDAGTLTAAYTAAGRLRAAGDPDEMIEEGGRKKTLRSIDPGDRIEPRFPVKKAVEEIEKTLARTTSFRFIVMGDTRSNFKVYRAVMKSLAARKPLFTLVTGDLVAKGSHREFQEYFRPPLEEHGGYALLPVVGNHDLGKACLGYENLFGEGARVYRVRGAGCLFVVLDNCSRDAGSIPWNRQLEMADRWMTEAAGDRKFVLIHKPPSCVAKWAYHAMKPGQSRPFCALMTKHEVDHVFAGHIHAYSTAVHQGVTYTVTGGGGAPLHPFFGPEGAIFHYLVFDVEGGKVKGFGVKLVRGSKEEEDF